jgi:hypothetical protein
MSSRITSAGGAVPLNAVLMGSAQDADTITFDQKPTPQEISDYVMAVRKSSRQESVNIAADKSIDCDKVTDRVLVEVKRTHLSAAFKPMKNFIDVTGNKARGTVSSQIIAAPISKRTDWRRRYAGATKCLVVVRPNAERAEPLEGTRVVVLTWPETKRARV